MVGKNLEKFWVPDRSGVGKVKKVEKKLPILWFFGRYMCPLRVVQSTFDGNSFGHGPGTPVWDPAGALWAAYIGPTYTGDRAGNAQNDPHF